MASVTFVDAPFWDTEYLMEQAWQPSPDTFLDGLSGENDIQIIEGLGNDDNGETDTRGIIRDVLDTAKSTYETERRAKADRDMSRAEREADAARRAHELTILEMREAAARRAAEAEAARRADAARRASEGGEEGGLSTTAMIGIGVAAAALGYVLWMRRG